MEVKEDLKGLIFCLVNRRRYLFILIRRGYDNVSVSLHIVIGILSETLIVHCSIDMINGKVLG